MNFQSVISVACFTALLAGLACGDSVNNKVDNPGPDAPGPGSPSGLSYGQPEIVATRGVAISPAMPAVTGTVTGWSVNPALPSGLSLNPLTGVIAGAPTAMASQGMYTVTASNNAGSTDVTLKVTVNINLCRDIPTLPAAYADWPALQPAITPDPEIEAKIAGIVAHMTINQKIGQMAQGEILDTFPEDVAQYSLGSILNGGSSFPTTVRRVNGDRHTPVQTWRTLADAYFDASPSVDGVKIPVLWGIDAVHGNAKMYGATVFPHNIGLGAAHDGCLVAEIGAATAAEVRASGQDWAFAPTLAVVRDDRWGRTYEGFSEDPTIVRWYAEAVFKGMGGLDPSGKRLNGILATAKHFIGDGGTTDGVDQGNNQFSERDLINIFGQGYFGALGPGGGQTVMISFNRWNGDRMHGNRYLITDVLKTKMGFDGLTVTDWNGHGQVPGCRNDDCPQAVNAGIDLFMLPNREELIGFITNTIHEVMDLPPDDPKHIPMERINDAVTRILRVKARAGLLGSTVKPSQREGANDAGLLHRDLARKAVRESLVLLKNEGEVLPLAIPTTKKVLVVGNGADDFKIQTGGWTISWQSGEVTNADFPEGVGDTILAGIKATVGADKVDFYATAAAITAAIAAGNLDFSQYSAVIAVVGETPYAEGAGDILASMTLGREILYSAVAAQAVLDAVNGHDVPVVTVLLSGRPLWVNKEINRSNAFVAGFLPGTEGAGIADLLFKRADGTVNFDFSGRLPYSWPWTDCQTPLNAPLSFLLKQGDQNYNPLFGYGYGLSYASGAIPVPKLSEATSLLGCGGASADDPNVRHLHNSRGAIAPYSMFLGAPGPPDNFRQLAEAPANPQATPPILPLNTTVTSAGAHLTVTGDSNLTLDVQGDGRRVVWKGDRLSQVFMQSDATADLSAFQQNDGALVFRGRLNAPTTATLTTRINCVSPCSGTVNITQLIGAVGTPTTFKIPLACFKPDSGTVNFTRINTTFRLETAQALDFTFAEVKWVQNAAHDPDAAKCPTLGVATPP